MDLRSHITLRSAFVVGGRLTVTRKTEVTELGLELSVLALSLKDEDVVQFDVPVSDVLVM